MPAPDVDGVLVHWGDRLFYPGNRIVRPSTTPRLKAPDTRQRAAEIRARIAATVVGRAPQVMVKVTGGGRGMKAIAAHFRYISKNGRLDIEDERGQVSSGRDGLHALVDDWRYGGTLIDDMAPPGGRREAFNIMLSMPRGTDPLAVQRAAREFAQIELADHKVVMVLHDHQANPHVHLSVRAESKHGRRLNPRKADLRRWRETFAEKLRGHGIEAEATRQATRGMARRYPQLWQVKARADGRLLKTPAIGKRGAASTASRDAARTTWRELAAVLASTGNEADRQLARSIEAFASNLTRQPELAPKRNLGQKPTPSIGDRLR